MKRSFMVEGYSAPVPRLPLHHWLRQWSPSPSKLGEEK